MRRLTCAVALLLCAACGRTPATAPVSSGAEEKPAPVEVFVDRARETGIDFTHFNGMTGAMYAVEIFGPGAALFDYDNDGDLDLFLLQGHLLGGKPLEAARLPPAGPLHGRLFRNDLTRAADGSPSLHFTDVTQASGITADGYGMGVATGDFDNDGWMDLYVTNFGRNQMLRNNGDGTFRDVTLQTGTGDRGWSSSASFVDIDRDGWLDLYVAHYLVYSIEKDVKCSNAAGAHDYCAPIVYPPERDRLYHNRGNGTFEDITDRALGKGNDLPGLGVVQGDFNEDGWLDLYVANDGRDNNLWINQRDGTFTDMGVVSGAAVNADGKPESSMGVDAGDFDRDGDEDLYMTHWQFEKNTLYTQVAPGLFEDTTARSGIGPPTVAPTGFGTGWLDYDNDGWLDLFVANGAVVTIEALARGGDPFPLGEPDQLFRNTANGRFTDVSATAGAVLQQRHVGRGAAFGDIDNDGDIDVVVSNNNGPAELLLNQVGNRRSWIGLRLVAADRGHRDLLGARVGVMLPGGSTLWRRVHTDGSYISASDPRVLVGIGDAAGPVGVRVEWPDGKAEEWSMVHTNRWTTLTQGTAR